MKKNIIVVNVSGGVVQEVYALRPSEVRVVLVDHDNIAAGAKAGDIRCCALKEAPNETLDPIWDSGIQFPSLKTLNEALSASISRQRERQQRERQ